MSFKRYGNILISNQRYVTIPFFYLNRKRFINIYSSFSTEVNVQKSEYRCTKEYNLERNSISIFGITIMSQSSSLSHMYVILYCFTNVSCINIFPDDVYFLVITNSYFSVDSRRTVSFI